MIKVFESNLSDLNRNDIEDIIFQLKYGLNIHPIWLNVYKDNFNYKSDYILEFKDINSNEIIGFLPLFYKHENNNRFFTIKKLLPFGYKPGDFFSFPHLIGKEKIYAKSMADWFTNINKSWDEIFINFIPKTEPTWKHILDEFKQTGYSVNFDESQKFLYIDTTKDYKNYIDGLGNKKNKYLRYNIRRLEREVGKVEYEQIDENIGIYFDRFFELYSKRKQDLNQINPFMRVKELESFTRGIIDEYEKNKWIKLDIIKCDGKEIALSYNYYFNNILYYSMPAIDPLYSKYSPGNMLLSFLIKNAFRNPDIKEFNFMRLDAKYKRWWNPNSNSYVEISIKNNRSLNLKLNNLYDYGKSIFN